MRNKIVLYTLIVLALVAGTAWAISLVDPYSDSGGLGQMVADGYIIRVREDKCTHIDSGGGDALVNKGDAILIGDIGLVGIALESASASTSWINIARRGIHNLSVLANNNGADCDLGDRIFINTSTGDVSSSVTTGVKYGWCMSYAGISASATTTVAVLLDEE